MIGDVYAKQRDWSNAATAYKKETQSLLGRIDESSHAFAALQKQLNEQAEQQQKIIKLQQDADAAKEAAIKANLRFKKQQQVVNDVYDSYSWRITSPLRKLVKLFIG